MRTTSRYTVWILALGMGLLSPCGPSWAQEVPATTRPEAVLAPTETADTVAIGILDPTSNRVSLRDHILAKTFEDGTKIDIFRLERNRDGLFLVREGNDAAGNCIVSSIAVTFTPDGTLVARMAADGGRGDNRCIGDPCSLCNSFKEGVGCSCAPGKGRRCNHEIRGVSGLLATDILQ